MTRTIRVGTDIRVGARPVPAVEAAAHPPLSGLRALRRTPGHGARDARKGPGARPVQTRQALPAVCRVETLKARQGEQRDPGTRPVHRGPAGRKQGARRTLKEEEKQSGPALAGRKQGARAARLVESSAAAIAFHEQKIRIMELV